MKVETYGIKMVGLEEASKATMNWPKNCGGCTQISYDRATGQIYTTDHVGDSWTKHDDNESWTICFTSRHMSAQAIADKIAQYYNFAQS